MKREGWNVSKGRSWVVVAFWGEETTIEFCANEREARGKYDDAVAQGADAFYAQPLAMTLQEIR